MIAGDGELKGELHQLIDEKKLETVVRLMGFRQDIRELLLIADLFVLPSLDEGMPMSLLEAVASRTPVIATVLGDIPKLIRHEESGLIIPANDAEALAQAVRELQVDRQKRERLPQTALCMLERHYSSERMYKQYEEAVYDRMAGFSANDQRK